MKNSVAIVAEAAEERRTIAQLIKPTNQFEQVYFCCRQKEISFLLSNTRIDMILCDVRLTDKATVRFAAELSKQAQEHGTPLIFFSALEPDELPLLGIVPGQSNCLSYHSAASLIADLVRRLLTAGGKAVNSNQTIAAEGNLIDSGSGLYNRFYFDAILEQEMSRSKLSGRPFSLLLIDIERPTVTLADVAIMAWTAQLPSMAMAIKSQIRTSDMLCRIEKKRLALLLPETSNLHAERVMGRIRNKVAGMSEETPFELKYGLASPGDSGHFSRHGLLRKAEAAL